MLWAISDLGDWGQAKTFALGRSVTLAIFQGGRLKSPLGLREAQPQEAAMTYQRAVVGALHDLENALTAWQAEQRRRRCLQEAVVQDRRAQGPARDRNAQGVVDFLQVLDMQRNPLAAEQYLTDSSDLFRPIWCRFSRRLGWGWGTDFPAAPKRAAL